jgi:hypothetical protein
MTHYKYHCRRKCCHLEWASSVFWTQNQKDYQTFQQKQQLSKAMALNENLPIQFDKPQIKSRISTLITKVRLLDLYIHLDAISDKRWFIWLLKSTMSWLRYRGRWIKSLKSKIPVEEGIWINENDGSRAIQIIIKQWSIQIPKSWVKLPYIISSIIPESSKKLTVYRKIIKLNYISMACWDQQCLF